MNGHSFPPIYLPWSPASMTPDQVQHLTSLVYTMGIDRVLELGGGVSTFCLHWTLAHMPETPTLWTIEYSDLWKNLLVKGCGMIDLHTPNEVWHSYYDNVENFIEREDDLGVPELVLIDGPFAGPDPYARKVAVKLIQHLLHKGLVVFMDDIDRFAEQTIFAGLQMLGDNHILTRKENYVVFIYK